MNVKVTGCSDCPFCKWDDDYESDKCIHPERKEEVINFIGFEFSKGDTPNWCPLNKEPITIEKV